MKSVHAWEAPMGSFSKTRTRGNHIHHPFSGRTPKRAGRKTCHPSKCLARVYTEVLHFYLQPSATLLSSFSLPSAVYFQPYAFIPSNRSFFSSASRSTCHLLSVDRFTFSLSHFQRVTKYDIYFGLYFTGLRGHVCPTGGHMCPHRPAACLPWWLKAESRSAKLWCIRARATDY